MAVDRHALLTSGVLLGFSSSSWPRPRCYRGPPLCLPSLPAAPLLRLPLLTTLSCDLLSCVSYWNGGMWCSVLVRVRPTVVLSFSSPLLCFFFLLRRLLHIRPRGDARDTRQNGTKKKEGDNEKNVSLTGPSGGRRTRVASAGGGESGCLCPHCSPHGWLDWKRSVSEANEAKKPQ